MAKKEIKNQINKLLDEINFTNDNLKIIKTVIIAIGKANNVENNRKKRYNANKALIEASVLIEFINKIDENSPENDENIIVFRDKKYRFKELKFGYQCEYCDLIQGNCYEAPCQELLRKDKRRGYFKRIK